ncbi:MAG TPA: ABC transporter permease [Bacteroidales bacterium]|nr:ABC transporter permease [Bacteroidales bacterium]
MNRIRNNQLFQLIMANFRELVREPGVLFWGIVFPILMSLGLGIAFTNKSDIIRNIAITGSPGNLDGKPDTTSAIYRLLLKNTKKEMPADRTLRYTLVIPDEKMGNSIFHIRIMDWKEAMILLKRGNLSLILDEKEGRIRFHFDPMNPDAQLTYLKLTNLLEKRDPEENVRQETIEPLTVKGTRYIDFLVPGLIAMGVMFSCLWGVSYGIIEKRSKKLLRRMVATPMKRSNFLVALITVRVLMNFIESGLLFLFAWMAFGITIQGEASALLAFFIAGNMAFAGMSVFISCNTSKTEIGNGLINAVSMPMMVLSGIFFSYHNFPDWSIPFIQKLPLTMFADGIRSIFIEGAGWADLYRTTLILALTGIIFFLVGLRIFKWH